MQEKLIVVRYELAIAKKITIVRKSDLQVFLYHNSEKSQKCEGFFPSEFDFISRVYISQF